MEYQFKKLEKSSAELTITVGLAEMQPFLDLAVSQIASAVKFEGFRPGKATYDVIKAKFGEQEIWNQAAENAIAKNYAQAVVELQKEAKAKGEELEVVGQPEINLTKLAPGNEFVFTAKVALLPEVKIGDLAGIKIARPEIKVEEEKIEKVLEDLRKMRGKETLVLREAKLGDKAVIDFQLFLNKVPMEHGTEKNYPLMLGENRFIPGFEEQVLGLSAGQEKEFVLKFPENYWQKELAGKNGEFKIKVNNVYAIELPALDDEFAKSLGPIENLAKLKEQIKNNLEQEAKDKAEHEVEDQVIEQALAKTKFGDIPEALLHNESHKMIHEIKDNMESQGMKFADYLTHLKKTEKEFELDLMPQATQRVKTILMMRQLAIDQKIEASPDEIAKEVEGIKKAYANNPEAIKHVDTEDYKQYVKNVLGNRKVMEWLKKELIK